MLEMMQIGVGEFVKFRRAFVKQDNGIDIFDIPIAEVFPFAVPWSRKRKRRLNRNGNKSH